MYGGQMKINGLPSLGTILPSMFDQSVMNNKYIKKMRFGGYIIRTHREVRRKVKVALSKELKIKLD